MIGNVAIIVAAGSGQRMQSRLPKQFLEIGRLPILWYTLSAFIQCPDLDKIFVVVPEYYTTKCENEIITPVAQKYNLTAQKKITCIAGGKRRQDSVFIGLQAAEGFSDIVVIHDGVRPFITPSQISEIIKKAKEHQAVIFGIKPRDTVKMIDNNSCITQSIDRDRLMMAQTPQAFSYALIKRAHEFARSKDLCATDDAMLIEQMGNKVFVAPGHALNIKITTPEDLILAKSILTEWPHENQ
jgi:2-C-methyl-D-erythritol 4-phosphate cytidylyltransferase